MTDDICKGSFRLGSGCAQCKRCGQEWAEMRARGWRIISPNIVIMDITTTMKFERLQAELREAREIIRPFANIKPSSLYPEDGSENEPYCVIMQQDYGNPAEITGAHLARARAFLTKGEKNDG